MRVVFIALSTLPIAAAPSAAVCLQSPKSDRLPQRILYIGDKDSPRAAAFHDFLGGKFSKVSVAARATFDPKSAGDFDVVLLDWPQTPITAGSENNFPPKTSPLGKREEWNKPTVLLGSAGLLLSTVWGLKAGAG